MIDYPITDSSLPFAKYIAECRKIIEKRRTDLHQVGMDPALIIDANSPYEYYPTHPARTHHKLKYGALLIHGLFDCPFSLRDIGKRLQASGVLCRSILLPGHGTTPSDLLNISYHDWIQAVTYGITSMREEVEHLFLIGYSTGAVLSLHHTFQDSSIAGLVLLAPAIKIKAPIDTLLNWHQFVKWISDNRQWIYREDEIDYAKYLSIAFKPVMEVNKLTDTIQELHKHHSLPCKVLVSVSQEDETISSHAAIEFFKRLTDQKNKLILYSSYDNEFDDPRIVVRDSRYPDLHIQHFSHVSLPFIANNPHYGQQGDYIHASQPDPDYIYGAYNRIEEESFDLLNKLGIVKQRRRQLTYNPDFDFMADEIVKFVLDHE